MVKFSNNILNVANDIKSNTNSNVMILGFGDKSLTENALIIDLDKLCDEDNISPKWSELSEMEQEYIMMVLQFPEIEIV